jgi:hypothetical protein
MEIMKNIKNWMVWITGDRRITMESIKHMKKTEEDCSAIPS